MTEKAKKTFPCAFVKMEAAGNDFIVIDDRDVCMSVDTFLVERLCARHKGIGADGILLLQKSSQAPFKMVIINADGSRAEMCGNGARCIARFACDLGITGREFFFETDAGMIQALIHDNGNVSVGLTQPGSADLNIRLQDMADYRIHCINTGVPHAVILVDDLSAVDAGSQGRAVRTHRHFAPTGTNVNFVAVDSGKAIRVRTYERGVEAETLACGTGATASAIITALLGKTSPPVTVTTTGGDVLTVSFSLKGQVVSDLVLTGGASVVYRGNIAL